MCQWFRTSFRANRTRISQPFRAAARPTGARRPAWLRAPPEGWPGVWRFRPLSGQSGLWRGTLTRGQASPGGTVRPARWGFSPRTRAGLSARVSLRKDAAFPPQKTGAASRLLSEVTALNVTQTGKAKAWNWNYADAPGRNQNFLLSARILSYRPLFTPNKTDQRS